MIIGNRTNTRINAIGYVTGVNIRLSQNPLELASFIFNLLVLQHHNKVITYLHECKNNVSVMIAAGVNAHIK
jgi:hypothetical protein